MVGLASPPGPSGPGRRPSPSQPRSRLTGPECWLRLPVAAAAAPARGACCSLAAAAGARRRAGARRGRAPDGRRVVARTPIADWAATRMVSSAVSSASRSRASTRGASAARTSRTRSRAVSGPTASPARRGGRRPSPRCGGWARARPGDGRARIHRHSSVSQLERPPDDTSWRRCGRAATARRAAGSRPAPAGPRCRTFGRTLAHPEVATGSTSARPSRNMSSISDGPAADAAHLGEPLDDLFVVHPAHQRHRRHGAVQRPRGEVAQRRGLRGGKARRAEPLRRRGQDIAGRRESAAARRAPVTRPRMVAAAAPESC